MSPAPALIIFDSGFGGLSVAAALRARGVGGRLVYLADHAGFPYGAREDEDVVARVLAGFEAAGAEGEIGAAILACSTASTLALPALRERWSFPIVGVVPAVKPAAKETRSGLISVLATAGTARRAYLRDLIAQFAGDASVTIAAAPRLAALAEAQIRGEPAGAGEIAREIAPAFVERDGRRTDVIALGCTHYPLILDLIEAAAPWPVRWIDPAEAVIRRLLDVAKDLVASPAEPGVFVSTDPPPLAPALAARLSALDLAPRAEPLRVEALIRRAG